MVHTEQYFQGKLEEMNRKKSGGPSLYAITNEKTVVEMQMHMETVTHNTALACDHVWPMPPESSKADQAWPWSKH